jgi:osmotically-inducible protein OsmY
MKNSVLKALVLAAAFAVLAGVTAPLHASQDGSAAMQSTEMQSESDANFPIQQAIQSKLDGKLNFGETNISTSVSDDAVVLSGNARDEVERLRALKIAQDNAGERRVVDHMGEQQEYRTTW